MSTEARGQAVKLLGLLPLHIFNKHETSKSDTGFSCSAKHTQPSKQFLWKNEQWTIYLVLWCANTKHLSPQPANTRETDLKRERKIITGLQILFIQHQHARRVISPDN